MTPVFNTVNLIIGGRGTGKTVFTVGDPKEKLPAELIPVYIEKKMKVLIVDTINHPAYQHVPIIQPLKINENWKKGVYRTYLNFKEIPRLLEHLCNDNFYNGCLIFEDAYKYQKKKVSDEMAALIGDSKQKNIDLFYMYHNWSFVPLDLIRYLDYIEHFKTKRGVNNREKDELGDHFDSVLNCFQRVDKNPNRFYHESVNVEQ